MFEWDEPKATINFAKHNVTFDEAATVFGDDESFDGLDRMHSRDEQRRLRVGRSSAGRIVFIAYTVRRSAYGETIRIISARPANREEELGYVGTQD